MLAFAGTVAAPYTISLALLSGFTALLVATSGVAGANPLRTSMVAAALSASALAVLQALAVQELILPIAVLLFAAACLRASLASFIAVALFSVGTIFAVLMADARWGSLSILLLAGLALVLWRRFGADAHSLRRQGASLPVVAPAPQPVEAAAQEIESSERMAQRAAEVVGESLHRLLATLRAGTRSQNALVLWFEETSGNLRSGIAELSTEASFRSGDISLDGVLAAARASRQPADCGPDAPLPWREDDPRGSRALVAEISDEGMSLGFLCVEKHAERRPYQQADHVVIASLAQEAARVVRAERLLLEAARTRRDMEVLYEAAEALNEALSESEVYDVLGQLFARMLGDVSVAVYHEDPGTDVLRCSWSTPGFSPPREVPARDSLIGLSIHRRHSLPYRPGGEQDDPPVFGTRQASATSLLVSPLSVGHETRGAIVMLSNQRALFAPAIRERIGLVVNYVASSLGNARAYEQMVVRATTDGMTQLLNHVTFKDRAAQALERAERSERTLTVVLTDIDFFKSVNDTHGHAVGDEVIRAVAGAIREEARKVDLAARYGGEEFALVLEDTDAVGAMLFANRLREHVQRLVHTGVNGPFSVTISLGVAERGSGGKSIDELLRNADEALYFSKEAGRNRATMYAPSGGRTTAPVDTEPDVDATTNDITEWPTA